MHQALQLVGKLELPGRLNTVAPGLLVYINDQLTGRRFLVDTGAAFSILPHQSSKPAAGQGLVGPNGSAIRCWGESAVKLQLAGQHFTWNFLLADVSMAILGIDFLRTHNLMVDPANCRLVQAGGRVFPTTAVTSGPTASVITGASPPTSRPASAVADVKLPSGLSAAALSVGREALASTPVPVTLHQAGQPSAASAAHEWAASAAADIKLPFGLSAAASSAGRAASSTPPTPAAHQQAGSSSAATAAGQRAAVSAVSPTLAGKLPLFFQLLLQRFEDVVNPSKVLPQTSHGVEHHLDTRGLPIASPFRRLDAQKLAAAKTEFAALERDGIIRQSSSPWASPLHMVKKQQCCSDYCRLNNVTVPDTYPLPNMMDFSSRVAGCSIFTKIDLHKRYFQIPLHPADILKTPIITPFGLFEFLRLTFGLRNVGSTFQRLKDRVLAGLAFTFLYLDDIIIASPSMEQDVEEVFRRLQAAGLVINFEKCTFALPEVDFLGHRVSASGFAPLPSRVAAIQNYLRPATVKQLLAFLGVFNFYRRFVSTAAKILRPLTNSTRGSPKATAVVEWTPPMEAAFEAARTALGAAALLAHPQQDQELAMMVDASADHVGLALQRRRSPAADWQPLAFFSTKLEPAQMRYSAFDRELFACVSGIRHFRYMLEGRPLHHLHRPQAFALDKVSEPWTAMQSRQLSYVAEFTTDIWHIPGSENILAFTLSQTPLAALPAAATGGPAAASPVNLVTPG